MMDIYEAECPYDTSPVEMEEHVSDRKDDNNGKNDEQKEAEFPDDTSLVDIEGGVSYRKDEKNGKMMRKKSPNSHMTLPLLICRKV